MTGAAGTALCVVCEEYADGGRFPRLVGAGAQMDEIVRLLEGLGYEARKVGGGNPSAAAFDDESEEWSSGWLATGDSKPALIIWSGHGVRVDGETRLVLSDLKRVAGSGQWKTRARRQGVTADDLVSAALDSGAEHVILIIDTCYAGGGAVPALRLALSRWEEESSPPGHVKWLGFLASCQSHETSDGSGPLLVALTKVLKEGPAGDEYRSAWSAHNALVSGPDLLGAIATRWEGEGQTPVPATLGEWRPAFPNPLHSPEAPARLVEHLVQAARGVGHREEGWFFTGRTRVLGRIVEWLDEDAPGLFLVTGPAGCGKSAVLGRIATLADPEQRARAVESGALRDGDPDPGVRAERTLAAVHLRDLTPLQAAERLARGLGLPRPRSTDDFRAEVRELSPQPVLVVDGLDEVPAEHTQSVIEELVFPLSRSVPVLLGSRERVFRNKLEDNESLVQALSRHIGAGVEAVDLEDEPHTREDIGEYVRRRCEQGEMAEGPAREVGAAIAERATDVGGGFLFARLVTSTVLARAASGKDGSLLTDLPDSIDAAFENELRAVPARVRDDGTVLPEAAWDLLSALAWTVGQGMPAGGVWEAVAGALGGGVVYDETDVDWALSAFGRYIVEDAEEGQAVYRLYHREFVAHLRRREGPDGGDADEVVLRTLVDLVKRQGRVGDWSGLDPYVTRGLVRHAVRCGGSGIEMLRALVVGDEENARPYLAESVYELALALSETGLRDEALDYAREAHGLYEELCAVDPETHLPGLAASLGSLAIRLADTGDWQNALEPADKAVQLYRTLARQHPAAFLPNLAGSLNNLAIRLADAGDRRGALASAHEAAELYRTLTEQHPATFTPDLAIALNTLANSLADAGDRRGALKPAQEAAELYRTLTEQHPATFTPDLAMSLNNLANHLAGAGDRRGALKPAREAAELYSTLTEQHPAAFAPRLVTALNTLANSLAGAGDRRGALASAREATQLYRTLTEQDPSTFAPHLASTLNTLANHLAGAGNPQGALEPAHEAVRIRRALAEQHPATFTPHLADALNTLATSLADAGDRQGALKPAHEAVHLYRTLTEQHPATFTPHLADALNNLANHLAESGDPQVALEPAREATQLHRTLAGQDPATFTPDVAMSLNTLAASLADAGDPQGALEPAHEATQLHRTLTEQDPSTFTPRLALSLDNLANRLADAGDPQGALEPTREATQLYRTLTEQDPSTFTPHLALSLDNLANRLADAGDPQGALEPTREATQLHRTLTEQDPSTFTPHLALSLDNLANRLADAGDPQGALEPAHKAVHLYRDLAGQDPATFTPRLATTLNNLANRLADAGDRRGALASAREATLIRRDLAEQDPTTFTPYLATTLNNLAIRLAESGDRQRALEPAREATQLHRSLAEQDPATFTPRLATTLNNLASHLADTGDPAAAVQAYEQVIADLLAKHPAVCRTLTLERDVFLVRRQECPTTVGLRGLAQLASTPTADAPDRVTFQARSALRAYIQESAKHHDELAAVWHDETSTPLPGWLALSPQALPTIAAWVATPTWSDSCAYWTDHTEFLSGPQAAAALTEYALLAPDSARPHQALREAALAEGAPAAYRPLILGEQLADWTALTAWDESEQYLRAHPDLLELDPPDSVPGALLHAARTHDIATAYTLVRDRAALQQYIDNALTTGDADALRHAASIEEEVYDDQLSARTHHQAALLLADSPDEADPDSLAPLVAEASPDTRNRLISETAALSAAHAPQHAAHWVRIIQVLAATG